MKKQQPVAASRTKIDQKRRALKGFTKSYEIGLKSERDALVQLQNTRVTISRLFNTILNEMKGFKFHNIFKPAYFNSRAQIVISPNDSLPNLGLSQSNY